jgi:hypothetical protein
MSLEMSKYEVKTISNPPLVAKPLRSNYASNALWGIALDEWEVAIAARNAQMDENARKYNETLSQVYQSFKKDLKDYHDSI